LRGKRNKCTRVETAERRTWREGKDSRKKKKGGKEKREKEEIVHASRPSNKVNLGTQQNENNKRTNKKKLVKQQKKAKALYEKKATSNVSKPRVWVQGTTPLCQKEPRKKRGEKRNHRKVNGKKFSKDGDEPPKKSD